MKKFYFILLAVLCLVMNQSTYAQNGPNLLGARGTFSSPAITVNSSADNCTRSGNHSYSPAGNIGNKLDGCSTPGSFLPCSDYTYTSSSGGLQPEYTYTLIRNIGDANGGNCIKGDWRGQDHSNDGGYFMAVNGAPSSSYSPIFYQLKNIPVCKGTTYEFSAYVLNVLPKSSSAAVSGSEPNISFKVNGVIIGNSGPIPYTNSPTWVKVGGSFTATESDLVDLEVVNATAVASGNDLGLDDISFSVLNSNITLANGDGTTDIQSSMCEGNSFTINYIVSDITHTNVWYKWQISRDGGSTYTDSASGPQTAVFTGDSYTLPLSFNNVTADMNNTKYKLVVSTSEGGLSNPVCTYENEYTLKVGACGPTPVTLSSFTGKYANGATILDWQTSQEINNDRFELYRSDNGQDFSLVTTVKGAGFSYVPKNYSYTDRNVIGSRNVYYRLKQVDVNGKFAFSPVIKISLETQSTLEIFPNPVSSNFTVSFSTLKTANATLLLRNTLGQPVLQQSIRVNSGSNSITVNNLSQLKPGVYYLSISNDEIHFNSKLQKR